jgi:DNA topoisomerase I
VPRKKQTEENPTPKPAKEKPAKKTPRAKAAPAKAPVTGVRKTTAASRKKAAPVDETPKEPKAPVVRGNRSLVIVESPAKAKTIEKYLGPGFRVLASYGHIRDLPPKGKLRTEEVVGISITNGWQPRYVLVDRNQDKAGGGKSRGNRRTTDDIVNELNREAEKAKIVYLATDPDREGEAIAWHIEQALGLDESNTFRITFNEITRQAVQTAIANPSKINMERVNAQEARRMLDRVVGYPLSNLLGKKVTRGLSAGRVQSVAVKLIVEREREIEAFITEEYWKILALLSPQGTVQFKVDPTRNKILAKKKGKKEDEADEKAEAAEVAETAEGETTAAETKPDFEIPKGAFLAELHSWNGSEFKATNEAETDAIYSQLSRAAYSVKSIEQKDRSDHAPPPFTTSTLQQQANIRLRMSARQTMSVAQELYQGVTLGSEGQVALITYMRTDSTRISNDALTTVRGHIEATYGAKYVPAKPNFYKSGKSAQEAHECVRPTDLTYTPARVQQFLSREQFRLYELIYNRFVACQMASALFAVTSVEVEAAAGIFRASGRIEKFDGFRRILAPAGKQEETTLPALVQGQKLDQLQLTSSQHFTQPPPRFNEASLVKMLEKEGIGRPSTYATIISTIQARGYVQQINRRFHATDVGKLVNDLLVKHFDKIVDTKFTSHIEEELDDIENGKIQSQQVLDEFWGPFSVALEKAETDMPKHKGIETGEACPLCGRGLLKQFSKKTGKEFTGCPGWNQEPPCKYIKPGEGEPERAAPEVTDIPCPTCGKMMIKKDGKYGPFLSCSGAPECKTTMNFGPDGKPVLASKETKHECEKCGKPMILKEWRGKYFLGCSGYPKCRNAKDADANGNPVKPIDTGVTCEKCNSPMVVKSGPRGPFLSCSGYPKCRNAKPMSPELKEKLKDLLPKPAPKKEMPTIEVDDKCPECGSPMAVKWFRGRAFLGCTDYPKCKKSKALSKDQQAQLQAVAAKAAEAVAG